MNLFTQSGPYYVLLTIFCVFSKLGNQNNLKNQVFLKSEGQQIYITCIPEHVFVLIKYKPSSCR